MKTSGGLLKGDTLVDEEQEVQTNPETRPVAATPDCSTITRRCSWFGVFFALDFVNFCSRAAELFFGSENTCSAHANVVHPGPSRFRLRRAGPLVERRTVINVTGIVYIPLSSLNGEPVATNAY